MPVVQDGGVGSQDWSTGGGKQGAAREECQRKTMGVWLRVLSSGHNEDLVGRFGCGTWPMCSHGELFTKNSGSGNEQRQL